MALDPVEISQQLIRCASVTPKDEGAQDIIIDALSPLGFQTYDVTRGDIRNTFLRLGDSGPHFCFCGHTDVVPIGEEASWTQPPFAAEIQDGKLYGRGAADMKSNIACFMAATSSFLEVGTFKGSISLLITGDEEGPAVDGTVKVLEWMAENGHVPDVALVGEPTNPSNMGQEIKVGRRGSLTGVIKVKGIQGHVAYPQLADNPLPKMVALTHKLATHQFDEGSDYFPPTNLELTTIDTGNTADNVIPEKTEAHFNVRFNDKWSAKALEEKIRQLLDDTGFDYALSCESNAESFLTEEGSFTALVSKAVEDITGRTPELSTKGGTSDARFVQNYCPVVEYGLINKTIHQVDEHTTISDIESLTQTYELILKNYFGLTVTTGVVGNLFRRAIIKAHLNTAIITVHINQLRIKRDSNFFVAASPRNIFEHERNNRATLIIKNNMLDHTDPLTAMRSDVRAKQGTQAINRTATRGRFNRGQSIRRYDIIVT